MSDDSHHIAHMLLGDNSTNKALENAVESGSRRAVKYIIDKLIPESWAWLADIIVDFVLDYFGW